MFRLPFTPRIHTSTRRNTPARDDAPRLLCRDRASSGDCSSSGLEAGSWPLAPHDSVENAARYCFACRLCGPLRVASVNNRDALF